MNLLEFFSREAGQKRRRWLDETVGDAIEYFIPPNLRPAAEFVAEANPVQAMGNAMSAGGVVFDPDQTREARLRAAGDMGLEMAMTLAPAALVRMGYLAAPAGLLETFSTPSIDAAVDIGQGILSDATYAARSVAEGDPRGVLEAFQRGKQTQSVGAKSVKDTPAGDVTPYADVEVIDPRDLVGAKISPTPADLTRAGEFYEGIDAAGTTRRTPLQGGPLFPLQQVYSDADIAWLVDSQSKGATKLGKDSDFVAVTAMAPKAHQSNASVNDAYLGTLEAYIESGRIDPDTLGAINQTIREFGALTKDPDLKPLQNFIGFGHPNFDEYMRSLTFDQRAAIAKQMQAPRMQNYGVPNFQKVLDATIQPEFAGSNLGDTLLLLELDKNRGLLNLADEGLPEHMSYDTGLGGRVVGRFENPVSRGLLFPSFEAEYSARPTMINKSGNVDEARMAYSFGRALPTEEITPEGARNIFEALQYYNIEQPRQAQLIEQALVNGWRTSSTPKIRGGIAPVDYERALQRNPSLPSLEPYTAKDVTQGAKQGDFEVFQLGDADVYFGLKKNPDYTWMNDGKPIPQLGENEVDLVGVISNEIGAKGVASPAIMGKAIEQGATVLNAFAVPSKRFPEGFLPNVYGGYGFKEVKRIPFSKEFYIEERGKAAYEDLLRQWRAEGWDESKGFPDVVLMKWSGTDAQRADASQRVFNEDFKGFGSTEVTDLVAEAGGTPQSSSGEIVGTQVSRQNIGSGDTGAVRSGSGASQSSSIRSAATELRQLTPEQRKNLGLLTMGF